MNNKPRNPSVFPKTKTAGDMSITEGGMTLRDYFAAKAMAAMVSGAMAQGARYTADTDEPRVTGLAYSMADAMLAERERNNG